MKKRKPPKLVVDNKLPAEPDPEVFTYEEFQVIANKIINIRKRYPEIDALTDRAHKNKDMAMQMALYSLEFQYDQWRDIIAEDKRNKLKVVKRKREP
jgi:hypothetical protein